MKRYKFNVEITLDTDENINNDLTDEELNNSFIEGFRELLNDEVGNICKVNVKEDLKWQKLKEWVSFTQPKNINDEFISGVCSAYSNVIDKMQELEREDE